MANSSQQDNTGNTPGASGGLEGTSYNAPYEEDSLKKRAMSKLEANENVRISLVLTIGNKKRVRTTAT